MAVSVAWWLCAAGGVLAQDAKPPLIGWLRIAVPDTESTPGMPLLNALAARGHVQGQTIRLEIRSAEGDPVRFSALAEDLVRAGASIIVAFGPDAARAARAATSTVPIVAVTNFLEEGFSTTIARPVGNLTGVSLLVSEIDPKKLEVLTELVPSVKHVAVLNDASTIAPDRPRVLAEMAAKLGVWLTTVDVRLPTDLETAFQTMSKAGAKAVTINASTMFAGYRAAIGELAQKYRVPAICQWRQMAEAGCLASYGVTQAEMFDLVGDYVDRILKGAKPSELPIVQPRKFELVINQKVARELGLVIPPALLLRADDVIE
jgi:putative ABC transport system substrate-binding protein